jgi:mono/diheme cytochrome c family protein
MSFKRKITWFVKSPQLSENEPSRPAISWFSLLLVLLGGLAAFGCTAHQKPSTVETLLANAAKNVVIPFEATTMPNPFTATPQVLDQGFELYQQNCAVCHGADGHAQTTLGQGMYPPAMDLASPHVQHWNDSEMFWLIQNGVRLTGMPSCKGSVSNDDTWKLVVFMRHLSRLAEPAGAPASPERPRTHDEMILDGKALYRREGCSACHRLGGEGTPIGPDLDSEGTRGRSTTWLIGHFKAPKTYISRSIMPSFNNLTDPQLTAIAAFLEDQKGSRSK